MPANYCSNNVNMFIVYSYKYALNLFEVLFYFLYPYKQIQRKMSACVFARITKSSFSKVFLITAKRSFSKVFWIKAVKVSELQETTTQKNYFNNVATQLYWNSTSTWWSLVDLLHDYIIKKLLKTPRKGCLQITLFAWLSISSHVFRSFKFS